MDEAKKIQLAIIKMNNTVTSRFGVAGLKAALDFLGLYGGPPRLPLLPLDEEGKKQVRDIMKKSGLL